MDNKTDFEVCQCPHCSFMIVPVLLEQLSFIKHCPHCGKKHVTEFSHINYSDGLKVQQTNPIWWGPYIN